MTLRRTAIWLTLTLLFAAAGCRDPLFDGYVELLNAEKRALEDELYDLSYQYEVEHKKLGRLIRENELLRQKLQHARRAPGSGQSLSEQLPFTIEVPDATTVPGDAETMPVPRDTGPDRGPGMTAPETQPPPSAFPPPDDDPLDIPSIPLPRESRVQGASFWGPLEKAARAAGLRRPDEQGQWKAR